MIPGISACARLSIASAESVSDLTNWTSVGRVESERGVQVPSPPSLSVVDVPLGRSDRPGFDLLALLVRLK